MSYMPFIRKSTMCCNPQKARQYGHAYSIHQLSVLDARLARTLLQLRQCGDEPRSEVGNIPGTGDRECSRGGVPKVRLDRRRLIQPEDAARDVGRRVATGR